MSLRMSVLDGRLCICRLSGDEGRMALASLFSGVEKSGSGGSEGGSFFSITRTDDEISVVCAEDDAPEGATVEGGWRAFKVLGTMDLSLTGVLAAISAPLADSGVPIFSVSTFDTDYILVREANLGEAVSALEGAGHEVFSGLDAGGRTEYAPSPKIRPARPDDEAFMRRMLAVAARVDDESAAFEEAGISRYLDGWGRDGDIGFIAEEASGEPLGAAWARLFTNDEPAYGFVDEETPEMAVGVREEARGRGVGRAAISHLISEAGGEHPSLSLSVREDNPAIRLYRSLGFEVVGETGSHGEGKSLTMKLDLR